MGNGKEARVLTGSWVVAGQLMDPNMAGMGQGEHTHMIGVPAGLPALQAMPGGQEGDMEGGEGEGPHPPAKFKPINLERLSPK